MAKKKKKKAKGGGKKQQEILLVGSKVREAVRSKDCNFGGDAIEGLNMWVHWLIEQATARAAANGRKTVRAHDFAIM